MMRHLLILAALTVASCLRMDAADPAAHSGEARHFSVFASMGALEIASIGINMQCSDHYALGIVASGVALGGHSSFFPNTTRAIGLRGSYYFSRHGETNFLWANAVAVDCQYLFLTRDDHIVSARNPGGIGVEAVVGRDGQISPGIGILWGAGIAATFHSEFPPLVFPALRLGLHIDV